MAGAKKRAERTEAIDALFDALGMVEKRAVLRALGGSAEGETLHNTEDVERAILGTGRSTADIETSLRRAEVATPKKHCLFGTVRGDVHKSVRHAVQHLGVEMEGLLLSYAEYRERDAEARLTFERKVQSYEWVPLPKQRGYEEVIGKRLTTARHAMIVRVDVETARIVVTYRGLPIGDDYDYEHASEAVLKACGQVGISVEALPVRGCIMAIISAKGRRIFPVRGDLLTPDGQIKLKSRVGRASIEQLVARLVEGDDDVFEETELLARITTNIGKHTFETLGLLWADKKILTRVAFWSAGADFLFVWGGNDPSFRLLDSLVGLFYELAARMNSADFNEAWEFISDLGDGAIVRPHEFRNHFKMPPSESDHVLLEGVRAGLLEPVFKLNAPDDFLDEIERPEWTTDLMSLRGVHEVDGVRLDGSKPESVLVAFRRMRFDRKPARADEASQ